MHVSELHPDDPRARVSKLSIPSADAMAKAHAAMAELKRRMDELEAAQPRKPAYAIERGRS
jgi:hypothetical protein